MGILGGGDKGRSRGKSDATLASRRSSLDKTDEYDSENLDKEEGNILVSIISQCELLSFHLGGGGGA